MTELYNKQFTIEGKTFERGDPQLSGILDDAGVVPIAEFEIPAHIMALGQDSPKFQEWVEERIRQHFAE